MIGFIKKGECLLRRHINVAHTFPNGKKVSSPHLSAVHLLNKWGRKTDVKIDVFWICDVSTIDIKDLMNPDDKPVVRNHFKVA